VAPPGDVLDGPDTDGAIDHLLALFAGELVEVEPSLRPVKAQSSPHGQDRGQRPILEAMAQELKLRGYGAKTRKAYLGHAERFLRFYAKEPQDLGEAEVRNFVLHLIEEEGASHSSVNQCVSALKFLYEKVLKHPSPIVHLPRPKKERKLPSVLSRQEVIRLIEAVGNPKHRALLMLAYSAGLRVGEVVRLQVTDVDSDRRLVHVRQSKGRKDRYVMRCVAISRSRSWRRQSCSGEGGQR